VRGWETASPPRPAMGKRERSSRRRTFDPPPRTFHRSKPRSNQGKELLRSSPDLGLSFCAKSESGRSEARRRTNAQLSTFNAERLSGPGSEGRAQWGGGFDRPHLEKLQKPASAPPLPPPNPARKRGLPRGPAPDRNRKPVIAKERAFLPRFFLKKTLASRTLPRENFPFIFIVLFPLEIPSCRLRRPFPEPR